MGQFLRNAGQRIRIHINAGRKFASGRWTLDEQDAHGEPVIFHAGFRSSLGGLEQPAELRRGEQQRQNNQADHF